MPAPLPEKTNQMTRKRHLPQGDWLLNLGILNCDVNNLGVSSMLIISCFLLDRLPPCL